ncbi:DUF1194 domain-containing protein, partial [Microvirga tunisiensis]
TTPTRIDNLNSIHSRTVLFDVNKDSQCQIRQFLQGGPPRMRTLIEEGQLLDRDLPTDHYEASRSQLQTDIALAIRSASALLNSAPSRSPRSVINIVGNGPSNSGMEPAKARDAAQEAGQIVNGLVVGYGLASDVEYYRTHVVGGPGSFVMQVSNPQEMMEAFLAKFRLDIAGPSEATASDEQFLPASATDDPDP